MVESAVDALGPRLTGPRAAHQREGHERFTLEAFSAEEHAVLDLVDARANEWFVGDDSYRCDTPF